MISQQSIVRFRSIAKWFPGVAALRGVTFDVSRGSCQAWMGENGAGKSTLGKILAGIHKPDGGEFEFDGIVRRFHSPLDARRAGIAMVHQELASCPNLSVAENLFLGQLPRRGPVVDRRTMFGKARELLDQVGAGCNAHDELGRLSTAQIQLIQIASALLVGAKLIVMDEPTSSLSTPETERLYQLIAQLRAEGTTIIYVSHRMEEIFKVCDAVTVLRDGEHVETRPLAGTTTDELVRMMIGRDLKRFYPIHGTKPRGPELLKIESLSSPGKFRDISFSVHAGEVVGLAGLVGAGRSEIALALFGLDPKARGRVFVRNRRLPLNSPRQAMAEGIGLVPEDRKRQGLVLDMSCRRNVSLSSLHCPGGRGVWGRMLRCPWCSRRAECLRLWSFLRFRNEWNLVTEQFKNLQVNASSPEVAAATLSGGNQQKIVLAKWFARGGDVLILDEPTRGVDVAAKSEIHAIIDQQAALGRAVLLISSELPEILNLSTRILVLREGHLAGEVGRDDATQHRLMHLMAGVSS